MSEGPRGSDDHPIKRGRSSGRRTLKTLYERPDTRAILFLILLMAFISLLTPAFLSSQNVGFILLHSSVLCIIALGETLVVLLGMIDLSPAATASFAGILIGSKLFPMSTPADVAIQIGFVLLVGFGLGIMNGLLIMVVKIPSIIATLGTMIFIEGLTLLYSGGFATGVGMPPSFTFIGQGYIFGVVPTAVVIMVLLVVAVQLVVSRTIIGRNIVAIGGSEEAVVLSGINADRIKIAVWGFAGLLAALGGIVLTAELNSAYPDAANGFLLPLIAAVVIGGTKLMSGAGEGGAYQTLVGAVILSVITNALIILGISAYYQDVVTGIVLLAATAGTIKGKIAK